MQWMIYGANGYTGKLIAKEARRRGLQPILAGRNTDAVRELATELGLPWRIFALDRVEDMQAGLRAVGLVLHCAGPFSATAAPMLEACLATKTHYLDITGEVDVFAHCHAQDARAKQAGIVVLPGAGFDVVPTDCLAAMLKRQLPQAESLVLAFDAGGGFSPGTAKSSIEGLGKGGRVRKGGVLQHVPLAWKSRTFERPSTSSGQAAETRTAMTIPWGDVYTAFVSTGIPDIEVYTTVPPSSIARIRRLRLLGPLLGWAPVQWILKRRVEKNVRGPSEKTRAATQTWLWGEARGGGSEAKVQLRTPNGYALTVTAALGIVEHLLQREVAPGYYTPSLLMGPEYVLSLPGVSLEKGSE